MVVSLICFRVTDSWLLCPSVFLQRLVYYLGRLATRCSGSGCFCVKADKVKRTMITAAFIFAVVPISLAVFGFLQPEQVWLYPTHRPDKCRGCNGPSAPKWFFIPVLLCLYFPD